MSVLVVEEYRAFADLLAMTLANEPDFDVVATVGTTEGAVALAAKSRAAMVVIGIPLGGQDGLDATRRIRHLLPRAVVVVISAHGDPRWVAKVAGAGANAFAPKSGSFNELLWILRHARNGSMLIAPSMLRPSTDTGTAKVIDPLTLRERDVLVLMGNGVAPTQIALTLHISVHTCRDYVKSIHTKLGAHSQLEAVIKARQLGLLQASQDLIA